MELKSSIACAFLLMVLLQLNMCKGAESGERNMEVYEIDYRGPETHSLLPPPDHSRGSTLTGSKSTKTEPPHANLSRKQMRGR